MMIKKPKLLLKMAIAPTAAALLGLAPSTVQAEPNASGELETSTAQADSETQVAAAENGYTKAWAWWKDPSKVHNGGLAVIRSWGENIVAEDFYPDGWGTRAQLQVLKWDPAGYRYWANYGGVCFDDTNRGNSAAGRTVCERNVAEGRTFRVHVWASKSGTYRWHSYSPGIVA